MGRVNIGGLKGLSANDRDYAEQEYLRTIQGWNALSDSDKDAFYRDDNFRLRMIDNNLSPQLNMEYFIGRKDNYTSRYYREQLTNYLLGSRPATPEARDNRAWYEKLLGIGNDGTEDFSYRMKLAEQQGWDEEADKLRGLTNEQLQQRVLDKIASERANFTDAQREQEEAQRKEREEKLQYYRGLSGTDRDRIYADQMFEDAFKGTKDWEILKNLHPSIRDEIYNNPRFFVDHPEGTITDADEDYRTWYEKAADGITRGLMDASLILTPEYAKGYAGGLFGLADYLRGEKKGEMVGTAYGSATGSIWNTWIQGLIGAYGPSNISKTLQSHDKETTLDELHAKSNLMIKSEIGNEIGTYSEAALANQENDPNWIDTLDKSWEELTKDNPVWQTFKNKDFAQLSDGEKIRLISQTKAIADKYGTDTAMQILNDDLNDIVSNGQGTSFLRSLGGAGLKFAASKGEKLVWLADKVGLTDAMGMTEQDTWQAMRYLDNVDKLGVLSSRDQEDIVYGTNTQAYKDFVTQYMATNGGSEETARQAWIDEQEATGEYKGYGISPNKRVRATGTQHNWFSIDGALDAFEMSGYIADQATAQWTLGKLTKGLGKPIGAQSRSINDWMLNKIGVSAENRLAIQGALNDVFTKTGGYARAYYGSIPISVGYGMAAYDEVRQKGLEQIVGQINKEIDESPEYAAQVQAIYDKYGLIDASEGNAANAAQLREQLMTELNGLRQNWIERKKQEKAEDFAKLNEEAHDAYSMNFILESLRNTGINLSYRSWLYKDASRAVHGGRIPLDLPNFEKTLGKIGFKDTGKKLDQRILNTNFGKKFGQYVQDEEGNLVRNTSKWRTTAETANQVRKNVWGGFWSNYMDDVSVGFSAGFNLYDFNDYMQAKYNPETYGETADLMSSFVAGAESGAKRMLDEQSFTDGFIGAMGSLVSVNPAGFFAGAHALYRKFTHDETGKPLSKIQIANLFLGNPILGTIGMVQEERAATDARLERLNKMIADNGVNINDTQQLLHWAAARKDNHDFGDFLDMKDANDGLGFAILYNLAKLEEEGGHYGEIAKGYFEDLERLARGGENITNEDINAFLGNPENRHLLDEHVHTNEDGEVVQMDDEGKKLYAQMQLQSNAQKLLDMNKKLRKNLGNVKKAFQNYNINDDAAVQLAYSLTMQGQWEDRLKALNKKVANSQDYSTESNEDVEYRSRTFTEKRLAEIDAKIKEIEKQIAQHQAVVDQLEGVSRGRALREAANTEGSLRDKYNAYNRQRAALLSLSERLVGDEQLKTSKQALKGRKKELAKLKDIRKHVATMLKERDKTPNTVTDIEEYMYQDPAIHDVETLNKHQIMALNSQQRANMILAPETYSKAQQEVIKELIAEEEQKNPDFKTDIRDAAILYNRLQQNKQTIDNIMADRENFNRYAQTVAMKNLMYNSLRYYNSDEYKALVDNSQKRKEFVAQMPATDDNQRNIVNSVVDYLQNVAAKGKELDLTNTAEVMQLFDENKDAILKALNESKTATLETPNGTIDMIVSDENNMSVRDLLQRAVEANAENQRVIEERQQEVSVPKSEVAVQPEPAAPVKEGKSTKPAEEPTKTEYKVSQKATDEGKLGVDAIVKYLNGEPTSSIQLSFLDPLGEEGQREGEEDAEYAKRLAQKYIDQGYIEVSETAPEIPVAPVTPTTTGRYQVNPDVIIDRETANKELGNNYTELAEDDFVNSEEQNKLQATARYLNEETTAKEYLREWGFATGEHSWLESNTTTEEEIKNRADEIANKYKKYLKDTEEGSGKPIKSATPTQPAETHQEAVDNIKGVVDNIFEDEKGNNSSTIEFSNPFLWEDKYDYTAKVKELFRSLFGEEGISAMDRILREEAEKNPADRRKVYFVVPKAWHDHLTANYKQYNLTRDLPVVAVVEDSNGGIKIGEKSYTPIGLAPASSQVQSYSKAKIGQFRMEPVRQAAIKEGVVQTDQLITDNTGKPVTSKVLRINRITPPSMKKGIFKSIMDIALAKLGFNETQGKAEDIFQGKDTGKETSLYASFRDNFLSKLIIKKNPKTEDKDLFYEYPYESGTKRLQIFINPLTKTTIEVPEGILENSTTMSLFEALQRKNATINDLILAKSNTEGSAMLKILVSRIQYELDKIMQSDRLTDSEGNLLMAEDASKGLTKAFNKIFYNGNSGTNFSIKVDNKLVNEEIEGQEIPHIRISLNYNEGSAELITLPINAERLDNNTAIDIIRRFLFDGIDGMGTFRGETKKLYNVTSKGLTEKRTEAEAVLNFLKGQISPTELKNIDYLGENAQRKDETDRDFAERIAQKYINQGYIDVTTIDAEIKGLNWNRHYEDLFNYEDALNNQETAENRAIVNIAKAMFDDGILSVSQEGIPGVYPYIAAPFDTTGRPVISSEVSNSDNAGNLEGNIGHAEKATITDNKSVTDVLKDTINTTIDKILKYSRQQREVIKQRREAAKEAKQTAKNHLSATTIAGIMYDSNFSEDSPYYYPSTMIGTDVDTFVRDFFETDDKGNFLFDKNSIDYSKYPTLSEEVLNEMVEGLKVLKQQMLDRGETRIISEEVITDGTIKVKLQDGRTIEVPNTGHLDMMTVDNMGKIHVYDMKTFRNDDAFQEKIFKNYATQLNVYKNLLEKQYGIKVDSVHIIPITVDYPAPSESNVYSERDGQLLLNDEVLQLDNPNTTRMGMAINVDALIKDAASKVRDEASVQAEAMLKAIGFTQEEIERLKKGNTDTILERKKKVSSYTVSLNMPMTAEVTLDMNSLAEGQRAKVNAIIEQLQKENGEQNPSQVASMKVEAAPATGIVINSDLQTDTKNPVPNAASAFVGREVIGTEEQTITEKKEEIDDTASCHTTATPKSGLSSGRRGRNIKF